MFLKVTDEELCSIEDEFESRKENLRTYLKVSNESATILDQSYIFFMQFRGIIAPCIESLIILDRLLYLMDQVNVCKYGYQ